MVIGNEQLLLIIFIFMLSVAVVTMFDNGE